VLLFDREGFFKTSPDDLIEALVRKRRWTSASRHRPMMRKLELFDLEVAHAPSALEVQSRTSSRSSGRAWRTASADTRKGCQRMLSLSGLAANDVVDGPSKV
jgi:hypothetical protein